MELEKNIEKKSIYEQSELTKQYHCWAEISKEALEHNIAQYKKVIGCKTLAPVIKSNAYGHGLKEVAHICQENKNVGWVCTATLHEAIILRKIGITKPVLVLSYLGENLEQAVLENISVTAYDIETINLLNAQGKQLNKKCKIHIKVDTGLSRLGVFVDNAIELIKYANRLEYIQVEGIWTHFAESQNENRTFTNGQIKKFHRLIENLETMSIQIELIHMSNSSGTTTICAKYDNFFRVGIGIYGYWPSAYAKKATQLINPAFTLKPVLTWKTRIFSIKDLPVGSFVGYNRTYKTKRRLKIALLPVGYFDGYERRLSNKGSVMIKNQYAPIVGIVCMNVLSVDITDLKDIKIGDEAILIGDKNGVRADEISQMIDMNPREVTTKIHPEVPRIIVD